MSLSIAPVGRLRTGARTSARLDEFIAGGTVSWFGEFRDPVTNALAAPAGDVEFLFVLPDGAAELVVAGALVSTGIYRANVTPDVTGTWAVRLYAAGARVDERTFVVLPSVASPDPVTPTLVVTPDGLALLVSSNLEFVNGGGA